MTDTRRTLPALQTLLADNTTKKVSPQDVRDFLVSSYPDAKNVKNYGAVGGGEIDDAAAFQAALDLKGLVYVPQDTYLLDTIWLTGDTALYVEPGTVFKLKSNPTATTLMIIGPKTWGSSIPEKNIAVVGGPYLFDFTDTPNNLRQRPINVQGAHNVYIENAIGTDIGDDNLITTRINSGYGEGGATVKYAKFCNIGTLNAPDGYGAIQLNAGKYMTFDTIWTDGGKALNIEPDGQEGEIEGIVAYNLISDGGRSALCLGSDKTSIKNIRVYGLSGHDSTYLIEITNPGAGGGVTEDVTIEGGLITGTFTNILYMNSSGSGRFERIQRVTIRDIYGDGAGGAGFIFGGIDMRFERCVTVNSTLQGFASTSSQAGLGCYTSLYDCRSEGSGGDGINSGSQGVDDLFLMNSKFTGSTGYGVDKDINGTEVIAIACDLSGNSVDRYRMSNGATIRELLPKDIANQTYIVSNVTPNRTFDANTVTTPELADVFGTLIGDLRAQGLVN